MGTFMRIVRTYIRITEFSLDIGNPYSAKFPEMYVLYEC